MQLFGFIQKESSFRSSRSIAHQSTARDDNQETDLNIPNLNKNYYVNALIVFSLYFRYCKKLSFIKSTGKTNAARVAINHLSMPKNLNNLF